MSCLNSMVLTSMIVLTFVAVVYPKFQIQFLKHEIRCNSSIITCSMSSHGPSLHWEAILLKNLSNLSLDFGFSIHQRNKHQYQSLANVSQDYCKFLENPFTDPFQSLFWSFLHVGNHHRLFEKCPVQEVTFLVSFIKNALIVKFF